MAGDEHAAQKGLGNMAAAADEGRTASWPQALLTIIADITIG